MKKIFAALITLASAVLFLAGNASAGFVANEAGIAAYVNVGTAINLDQAAGAYKTIEDRTGTYIIGTVDIPGSTDYEFPHVYTSSYGWVMAYYAKEQPRSKIVNLGIYNRNDPDLSQIGNTRLEDAISKVAGVIGIAYSTIKPNTKYYDFKYPVANGLTILAETRNTGGVDSFSFRVPNEFVLYDVSWEYYSYDSDTYNGAPRSLFKLDGSELSGTDGAFNHNSHSDGGNLRDERYWGTISALTKDVLHKGDLWYDPYSTDEGSSNIAIVLIYNQP